MSYCGTYYVTQCTMYVVQTTHEKKNAFYHFFELVLHPKLLHFHLLFFFILSFGLGSKIIVLG